MWQKSASSSASWWVNRCRRFCFTSRLHAFVWKPGSRVEHFQTPWPSRGAASFLNTFFFPQVETGSGLNMSSYCEVLWSHFVQVLLYHVLLLFQWFLANLSYQEALSDTQVAIVNILSSTSGEYSHRDRRRNEADIFVAWNVWILLLHQACLRSS